MAYVPALDGIRALAVILVMIFHSSAPALRAGYLGVDVFFVLSGFLITSLLLSEQERTGSIALGRFYLRRFARLMPPLAVCLLVYIVAAPHLWPEYEWHLRDAALSAGYLTDYGRAIWHVPNMLKHTWSLSVEEHFYLLWPLVIITITRARRLPVLKVLALLYIAATAWRFYCVDIGHGWSGVYPRFDTRLSGLILGAFAAASLRFGRNIGAGPVTTGATAAVLIFLLATRGHGDLMMLKFGVMVAELATILCIIAVMKTPAAHPWLGSRSLAYIGRLSYGLYLFHYPAMYYLRDAYGWEIALIGGSAFAMVLAMISYHTVEAWVRSWKANRIDSTIRHHGRDAVTPISLT